MVARLRPVCLLAAVVVATAVPAVARAQHEAPGFLLDRFTPATAGSDWFVLESLDFRGHAVRAGWDWSEDPFVTEDQNGEPFRPIVERQMVLSLGGAVALYDRVRLGLELPFAVHQVGADSAVIDGIVYRAPESTAVGDLRATVDVRLYGAAGAPLRLGAGSHLFVPLARRRYNSDGIVRVLPRLLGAGDLGAFSYAAALGFASRDRLADEWFGGYGIGPELFGGVALAYRPVAEVAFGAELYGFSKADGDFLEARRSPAELLFSARFLFAETVTVAVGAGGGLSAGKGSPEARFLARVAWRPGAAP